MKRLVLIAIAWLMCMSTYAQAYEVDFSVDQEKTTVSYKIKNNTKDYLFVFKGFFSNLRSCCMVIYALPNGETGFVDIDVIPDKERVKVIEPGETYQFQFELSSYRKKYHVTKLEGVFDFLYRESANDDLVPVRIKKVITL